MRLSRAPTARPGKRPESVSRGRKTTGREVEWVNRFLDQQRVRSVADSTLRSYAHDLLHFLRWWVGVNQTTTITEKALTESTLLDYIRFQTNQQPRACRRQYQPPSGDRRTCRCGSRFPMHRRPFVPGFQYGYWRPIAARHGTAAPGA